MDFFIKDDNVRPGNRGGRDQFKWDDVRMLNNKDRESYLGVSQSIGFLDKGGKWRKRDWWQNYKPDNKINIKKIQKEKEKIKKEEEQMLMDAIYGKNTKKYAEKQMTDFQWEKIMKKESNEVGTSLNAYEYYDDETHRAGLGVKTSMSFRTNPYDKKEKIDKLEGENVEEGDNDKSKGIEIKGEKEKKKLSKDSVLGKYIDEYVKMNKHKKKSRSRSRSSSRKRSKHKKSHKHRHHDSKK